MSKEYFVSYFIGELGFGSVTMSTTNSKLTSKTIEGFKEWIENDIGKEIIILNVVELESDEQCQK